MKQKIKKVAQYLKSNKMREYIETLPEIARESVYLRSKHIKLSLVMLVKDQEKVIEETLSRLSQNDIDEFIVVDTGSTDETKNILRSLSYVRLYEISWVEDFSYMRNMASKFSSGDWIMAVDSDEILLSDNVDFKLLISLLENVAEEEFSISFEQHVSGTASYGEPMRIYQPQTAQFHGLVHEELRSLSDQHAIPNILTNITIQNVGGELEEIERFNKKERYGMLLKQMRKKEPDNPRWLAFTSGEMLKELMEEKTYETLILSHLFESKKMILTAENLKNHVYTEVLLIQYISHLAMCNRFREAQKLIDFSLSLYVDNVSFYFYKSLIQMEAIKRDIKRVLKETLKDYLELDKEASYHASHRDAQMLELAIAELNSMNNQRCNALNIVNKLTDKELLDLWENWHAMDT